MSIKIQRIQSREAGPFARNGGRTRAHIEIPSSVGFSDLHNSNVVFRMETQVRRPDGTSKLLPSFIAQPAKASAAAGEISEPVSIMGAQALIRNSRVTSDSHGVLNEQRDQNVISANLDWYNDYSSCQAASASYDGDINQGGDPNDSSRLNAGVFLRPSRPRGAGVAGEVSAAANPSRACNAEVRCSLKHVDRLADGTRQFPNLSAGNITYRIELEDVRPVMSLGASFSAECQDIAATVGTSFGNTACPIRYRWARETEAGHTMQVEQLSLDNLPFYIGMPVKANYKSAGGAAQDWYTTISKLTLQETAATAPLDQDNVILIELAAPATSGNAAAITELTLQLDQSTSDNAGNATAPTGSLTVEYNIIDIFVELHTIQLTPQQLSMADQALQSLQIPYIEHRLVKKVLNATQDYAETLYIDANCAGLAVLTPQNNGLVSGYDKCNSYRFSFDGRHLTNRAIATGPKKSNSANATTYGIGRQLHNHMLQKFFGNLGKRLLKFDQPFKSYNQAFASDQSQLDTHSIFPLVTPMVPEDVIAQFQCSSPTNMQTKEMYYVSMYPRTLNFQKGNLVM
tara:strand:- start:1459 stop:3174 length:1716 start_codon:yes stop_codon:yes gene_type:complete